MLRHFWWQNAFLLSWKVFLIIAQAPLTWYTENSGVRLNVNFSKRICILILCHTAKSLSPVPLLWKIAPSVVHTTEGTTIAFNTRWLTHSVPYFWLSSKFSSDSVSDMLWCLATQKQKEPWHSHSSSNLLWLDWMSVYLIWPVQKVTQYSAVIECNYPFAMGKCTKLTL